MRDGVLLQGLFHLDVGDIRLDELVADDIVSELFVEVLYCSLSVQPDARAVQFPCPFFEEFHQPATQSVSAVGTTDGDTLRFCNP